jgi:hypothetical protein
MRDKLVVHVRWHGQNVLWHAEKGDKLDENVPRQGAMRDKLEENVPRQDAMRDKLDENVQWQGKKRDNRAGVVPSRRSPYRC